MALSSSEGFGRIYLLTVELSVVLKHAAEGLRLTAQAVDNDPG